MKNFFLADYLGCILFKALSPVIRALPLNLSFFLGRRLGDVLYFFDCKHKAAAYANIKRAFGNKLSPCGISALTRKFYQSFGQSLIEVFLIPAIDRNYIAKYITIEGKEKVFSALNKGKGVILAAVHAGSWELSNIISANLGFKFSMFVREQGLPLLNQLLNDYRKEKGCRIISREGGLKEVIAALKNNEAVGMTVDQGGNAGVLVDFFGRSASMPKGAVKLALKYKAALIPIFFTRTNGPNIKVWAGDEISLSKSQNGDGGVKENLQRIISVFERFILNHPKEYLWTYKIWKHSNLREILLLSDGRAGHLHQSEAVAKQAQGILAKRNIKSRVEIKEVRFRNKFCSFLFNLCTCFFGKYNCQGCLVCLKKFLTLDSYDELSAVSADIIISAGSSISGVNYILSRENLSKSVIIMRPACLGIERFDLVIALRHDRIRKRRNVVITDIAPNLIDEAYLNSASENLCAKTGLSKDNLYLGVLIGGNSKNFNLSASLVTELIKQLKILSLDLNAKILLTTSRRTPKEAEEAIKNELGGYPHSGLIIIANEKNIPDALGGILGLSNIIIASPESISMISEAASSKKHVVVFDAPGLSLKHRFFLSSLKKNKYIYMAEISDLSNKAKEVWQNKPGFAFMQDKSLLKEALSKIL